SEVTCSGNGLAARWCCESVRVGTLSEDVSEGSMRNDSNRFCQRAAHYLGQINALHPFREGNGRAQREFIRELAVEAGYKIAWDLVTQDEMLTASVASFHRGSSESFATILQF